MSESNKPFVITDRRKFDSDGSPRFDDAPAEPVAKTPEPAPEPADLQPEADVPVEAAQAHEPEANSDDPLEESMPPRPTAEQLEQSRLAFVATADRIDIAIRSANPGVERPPAMSFEQIVQSVYMQAILQLGGGTQEGQQPQVDLLGARQSIDMLGILAEKTAGNLSEDEARLIDSAIFELRLAFLEITQALARSAAARTAASNPPHPAPGGGPPRPSIVR